jgi:hypothetical protein
MEYIGRARMPSNNTNQPVNSDELQSATILTVLDIAQLSYGLTEIILSPVVKYFDEGAKMR